MNLPFISFDEFCKKLDCEIIEKAIEHVENEPTLLLDEALELTSS